jgi:predicted RNase H-like nuclease (RuvC/YqgF family)
MDFFVSNIELSLSAGLVGLAVVYWRSWQTAQTTREALEEELAILQRTSQGTQQTLEKKLEITTQTLQKTQRETAELQTQSEALRQQCQRLRDALENQSNQVQQDAQSQAFEQIQTLLTQYPSVRRMAETKPELPARNVVALLTSLENLVQFWGYQAIGQPWTVVDYDPQCHQGDTADLQAGEPVYIRFVGYRQGDRILIPAKVSRTLPAGVSA